MAVIKKKTRKRLSKQLNKIVKKHGAESALALVTGIVSAAAVDTEPSMRTKSRVTAKALLKPAAMRKRASV